MKRTSILLTLVLLIFAATANAQYVSTRLGTIQPYKGMYYDRNQSGSGLSVDIGPGGLLFLQFATYDAMGNQVNYITQPNFVPTSEAQRAATAVIGTATSQMYQVTGGQCPGCPYTAPTIHPLPLNPVFTWTRPRHVDMSFTQNGQTFTYHFDAGNYEGKTDEEFLPGTYAVTWVNDSTGDPNGGVNHSSLAADLNIMQVVQAPFGAVKAAPGSDPSLVLPPAGAHLYVLQCGSIVPGVNTSPCGSMNIFFQAINDANGADPITAEVLLWYDPATNTAGVEAVKPDGTVGPANLFGELYVKPETLTAHIEFQGHNAAGSTWYQPGQIHWSLTLTRVPDPTVRDCYDISSTCKP